MYIKFTFLIDLGKDGSSQLLSPPLFLSLSLGRPFLSLSLSLLSFFFFLLLLGGNEEGEEALASSNTIHLVNFQFSSPKFIKFTPFSSFTL